jgi:hypothetical protein
MQPPYAAMNEWRRLRQQKQWWQPQLDSSHVAVHMPLPEASRAAKGWCIKRLGFEEPAKYGDNEKRRSNAKRSVGGQKAQTWGKK